jgi:hypothetical protein
VRGESVGCNVDVLAFSVSAHCQVKNHNEQSCSAERLGITPQGMTEIFKGRNNPTGEQVLVMLELLKGSKIKTPVVPRRLPADG